MDRYVKTEIYKTVQVIGVSCTVLLMLIVMSEGNYHAAVGWLVASLYGVAYTTSIWDK